MTKRIILAIIAILFNLYAYPQNVVKIVKRAFANGCDTVECHKAVLSGRFDDAVELYATEIKRQQENRDNDHGVDGEVLAEYAYALALCHNFDYSLVNIDRARTLNAKHTVFYINQILCLMGNTNLANEFLMTDIPEWLKPHCGRLLKQRVVKYAPCDSSTVSRKELENVRKLAVSGQHVQALVLVRRLEEAYPDEYILPAVESVIWEELCDRNMAASSLKRATDMMNNEDHASEKAEYNKRLIELRKANPPLMKSVENVMRKNRVRAMVYAGGTIAKGNYSLNTRVGFYTYNQYSASLNLSFIFMKDNFSGSLGISGYKTWKFLVGGLGLSYMFGGENGNICLVPTVGVTFPNSKHTASFDVTFNCYVPLSKSSTFNWGLSFGRTFYF